MARTNWLSPHLGRPSQTTVQVLLRLRSQPSSFQTKLKLQAPGTMSEKVLENTHETHEEYDEGKSSWFSPGERIQAGTWTMSENTHETGFVLNQATETMSENTHETHELKSSWMASPAKKIMERLLHAPGTMSDNTIRVQHSEESEDLPPPRSPRFFRKTSEEGVAQKDGIQVNPWLADDLRKENAGTSFICRLPVLLIQALLFIVVVIPLLPVAVTDMYFGRSLGAHRAIQWWFFFDKGPVVRHFWGHRMWDVKDRTAKLLAMYSVLITLLALCLGLLFPYSHKWGVWALRIFFFFSVLLVLFAVYGRARSAKKVDGSKPANSEEEDHLEDISSLDFPSRAMRWENPSNWIFVLSAFYELFTLSSVVVRPESPVRQEPFLDTTIYNERWQALMVNAPIYTFLAAVALASFWLLLCTTIYLRLDVQNKQPGQFLELRLPCCSLKVPGLVGLLSGSFFLFTVVNLLRPLKPLPEPWLDELPSVVQKCLALIAVVLLVMYTSCAVLYQAWVNLKTDDFFISETLDFRFPTLHLMEEQLIKLLLAVATEALEGQAQGKTGVVVSTCFSLALCLVMLFRYRRHPCSVFWMNVFKLVSYSSIGWSALVSIIAVFLYGNGEKVKQDVWLPTVMLLLGWAIILTLGLAYYFWQRKRYGISPGRLFLWGLHNTGEKEDWYKTTQPELVFCTHGINPAQVAVGKTPFVMVVSTEGALYSYGRNDRGQLGHGDYTYRYYLSPLLELWDKGILAKSVACGSEHVLLLSEAGYVYSWGRADSGQLGLGNEGDMFGPLRVDKLPNPKDKPAFAVVAGDYHSLVLVGKKRDLAELYAFGLCTNGQLGAGYSFAGNQPPSEEQRLPGTEEKFDRRAWKLDMDKKELKALLPVKVDKLPDDLDGANAGEKHSILWSASGALYVTGSGSRGQLGFDKTDPSFQLSEFTELPQGLLPPGSKVVDGACGSRHTLLALQDGSVYATGSNNCCQLGLDPAKLGLDHAKLAGITCYKPTRLELKDIRKVEAGAYHSGAINAQGEVYTWGNGQDFQLGNGVSANQPTPQLQTKCKFCTPQHEIGFGYTQALTMGGSLTVALSWRDKLKFELGDMEKRELWIAGTCSEYTGLGTIQSEEVAWSLPHELFLPPVPMRPGTHHVAIADAKGKRMVRKERKGAQSLVLQQFSRPGQSQAVKQVALGVGHGGVVLLKDGHVLLLGQPRKKHPAPATTPPNLLDMADHTQEAKSQQVGPWADGPADIPRLVPLKPVWGGCKVVQLSCGLECTGLVLEDGSLWTWGRGVEGQLGLGEMGRTADQDGMYQGLQVESPTRVTAGLLEHDAKVLWLAMGRYHSVVLAQVGRQVVVLSCGSDGAAIYNMYHKQLPPAFGVLGLGNEGIMGKPGFPTLQRVAFDPLINGDNPIQVSAGLGHTLLVTEQGQMYSWGWGFFFALGHGSSHPSAIKKVKSRCCGCLPCPCRRGQQQVGVQAEEEGNDPQKNVTKPTRIRIDWPVASVDAGLIHSACVTRDGALFTWGMGGHGALGHGSGEDQKSPRLVEKLADRPVKLASAGSYQTCALLRNGQLWITGSSLLGALGSGEVHNSQFKPRIMGQFLGRENSGVACGNHQLLAW